MVREWIQAKIAPRFVEYINDVRMAVRRRNGWLEERGQNIYSRDWDVLVVLDACRLDLLRSVRHEFDFIGRVSPMYSVGGTSDEWMENTFEDIDSDVLQNTAYVTANPRLQETDIDLEMFGVLDEVWKYAWDEYIGTVHPQAVTERAIDVHRSQDMDQLIIHYMQPHAPFLHDPEFTGKMTYDDSDITSVDVWDNLRKGKVLEKHVWEGYQENLRRVLEEVKTLKKSIDADRMAITADHGNAMGEMAQYGHGRHERVNSVCIVPWVRTTAKDTGEYEPSLSPKKGIDEEGIKKKLQKLGYV